MSYPKLQCPACPVEVRDLFAVAHNIAVRMPAIYGGDLKRAVEKMQPIIAQHFADRRHSHPDGEPQPPADVNVAGETAGGRLLPCPFCGGTDLHIETNSVQPDDFHDAYVVCGGCDASGRHAMTLDGWLPSKAEARAEAVVAWNDRQPPAPASRSGDAGGERARFEDWATRSGAHVTLCHVFSFTPHPNQNRYLEGTTELCWRAWQAASHAPDATLAATSGATSAAKVEVPEGWQLVPIVADEDMIYAGGEGRRDQMVDAADVWRAMLAAAPKAPLTP